MNDFNGENSRNNYEEYEIDLRNLIMVLWNHKWFVLGLVILSLTITFFYSTYLVEPVYEAKSTLLILPPNYTSSLSIGTFSIETYKNLATTDSIRENIIDELNLVNDSGDSYTTENLENMMSVEVLASEENTNGNIDAPLIIMKVVSGKPETSANIANAWAQNFIANSREIRINEIREISTVITSQFEETEKKLNDLKNKLVEFRKNNRLTILNKNLKNKQNKLSEINNKIINLDINLGEKKQQLKSLQKQLNKMEEDGTWLGKLSFNPKKNNGNYNLIKAKNDYQNSLSKLVNFNNNNNIELLKVQIDQSQNRIKDYENKILSYKNKLNILEEENIHIEKLLAEEPAKWELNKSIDETSFWINVLSSNEVQELQNLRLSNEIINPIAEKFNNQLSDNKVIVNKLPNEIKLYEKQLLSEKNRLRRLRSDYNEKVSKKENLEMNVKTYQNIYSNFSNKYKSLISRQLDLKLEIERISAELAYYKNSEDKIRKEIEDVQNKLWLAENKKDFLNQRINDVKRTYEKLAVKVEEARISEAERTSDVKFYAEAVEPSTPISNNKLLNMAIAAVLALMLGIFIVFFKEFMKEDD